MGFDCGWMGGKGREREGDSCGSCIPFFCLAGRRADGWDARARVLVGLVCFLVGDGCCFFLFLFLFYFFCSCLFFSTTFWCYLVLDNNLSVRCFDDDDDYYAEGS